MKKIIVFLTAVVLATGVCGTANAQGFVVKGGLSYSNMDLSSSVGEVASGVIKNIGNYTGWHAGIGFQTSSVLGFSVQPELLLNQKGTKLNNNITWKMSYLELPVNIQWGPDLLICRPYVMVSPYIGYNITNKLAHSSGTTVTTDIENLTKNPERFSYGVGLGAGIQVFKFQVSAKYSWNFGKIVSFEDFGDKLHNIKRKNASCLEVSIALTL